MANVFSLVAVIGFSDSETSSRMSNTQGIEDPRSRVICFLDIVGALLNGLTFLDKVIIMKPAIPF